MTGRFLRVLPAMLVAERLTRRQPRLALRPPAPIAWVDLRTNIIHLLTPDAAAAGRVRGGRYIALCGAEVIPAAMTESGQGHCQPCHAAAIPRAAPAMSSWHQPSTVTTHSYGNRFATSTIV